MADPIDLPSFIPMKDRGKISTMIVKGQSFDAGKNLHGREYNNDSEIDYMVFSYSTAIAWHVPAQRKRVWDAEIDHFVMRDIPDHWVVPNVEGFSATVQHHSQIVRDALVLAVVRDQ